MNTNVTFLQMPMVGQYVQFASNSGVATSSVVIAVNSDPTNAGWYQVTTASGSIYCGPVPHAPPPSATEATKPRW